MASELHKREFIIRLFIENPRRSQQTIANKAKVLQSTVSEVIKKYQSDLTITRKKGSGRK